VLEPHREAPGVRVVAADHHRGKERLVVVEVEDVGGYEDLQVKERLRCVV
jgi:hypothetical protein